MTKNIPTNQIYDVLYSSARADHIVKMNSSASEEMTEFLKHEVFWNFIGLLLVRRRSFVLFDAFLTPVVFKVAEQFDYLSSTVLICSTTSLRYIGMLMDIFHEWEVWNSHRMYEKTIPSAYNDGK